MKKPVEYSFFSVVGGVALTAMFLLIGAMAFAQDSDPCNPFEGNQIGDQPGRGGVESEHNETDTLC